MINISITRQKLLSDTDIDWFDDMCNLLKKENNITVSLLTELIGNEDQKCTPQNRGSKFLVPFDKRFKTSAINPDIDTTVNDAKVSFLSFAGADFSLIIRDVITRFNNYLTQSNIYDGGTQLFFYPVPNYYEFSAISFYLQEEKENINVIENLTVHSLNFHFGEKLVLLRDGYKMSNQ